MIYIIKIIFETIKGYLRVVALNGKQGGEPELKVLLKGNLEKFLYN